MAEPFATSRLPGVPVFETVQERLDRLSRGYQYLSALKFLGEAISHDVLDWIEYLAYPCQVPVRADAQETSFSVYVGPNDDQVPPWTVVEATFTSSGKWTNTNVSHVASGRTVALVPNPSHGLSPSEAAGMLGLQLESGPGNLRPAWGAWRLTDDSGRVERERMEQDRAVCLARLRNSLVSRQVRFRALEGVGRLHPDDFQAALNAEVIMVALSSEWHPLDRSD